MSIEITLVLTQRVHSVVLLTNVQDNSLVSMQTSHFQIQMKTCAPTNSQQQHQSW